MAYKDPNMADADAFRAEKDEIALLQMVPVPNSLVASLVSKVELAGGGVGKIGAMGEEGPTRETGAIES
jgi:hypothetical protein